MNNSRFTSIRLQKRVVKNPKNSKLNPLGSLGLLKPLEHKSEDKNLSNEQFKVYTSILPKISTLLVGYEITYMMVLKYQEVLDIKICWDGNSSGSAFKNKIDHKNATRI